LFTLVEEDGEGVILGRAAVNDGAGWLLWEALPQAEQSGHEGATNGTLLPLPPGQTTLAVRSDALGARMAELIQAPTSIEKLIAHWRDAEWEVRDVPSDGHDGKAMRRFVCSRGPRIVYASLSQEGEETVALLVGRPTGRSEGRSLESE
jgi:hypothetical protein